MTRKTHFRWIRGVDENGENRSDVVMIIAGLCLFLIVASTLLDMLISPDVEEPQETYVPFEGLPDFAAIQNVKEKKEAFFAFMLPYVEAVNAEIMAERAEVLNLQSRYQSKGQLSESELTRLNELLVTYKFDIVEAPTEDTFQDLLSRADEVPASLALAQAALESGWGTSRFARDAYNLFGMRCYTPGCGIVPARRAPGAKFEVRRYATPQESFESYIRNLNTNKSYVQLRIIRRTLRGNDIQPSGEDLAAGLSRYSEEGYDYIGKVQGVIYANNLVRFD